jgi:catechol 2,3-dioxygenase-like lactoylglutathione lyase family enzyme
MVLPTGKSDFLNFCAAHTSLWAANSAAIGVTGPQVAAWTADYDAAKAKYSDALALRAAAKGATVMADEAIATCRSSTAELIRRIKLFAAASATPGVVYGLAEIPVPQDPSTIGPPGRPTEIRAGLNPNGSITLRWKCVNPEGAANTTYLVRRRTGTDGSFAIVGGAGSNRAMTDATVPAGVPLVQYDIRGVRGLTTGPESDAFNVYFGVAAGGGMTITAQGVDGAGGVKLAA